MVAGCAAPQGRELHRGTTVAPRPPPPVRPGHGAPVVGQPGSFVSPPPRSPHQRELPPSLEPGLWAGDQPQAIRKREQRKPKLFGVPLPRVAVDGDVHEQETPARACAAVWEQVLSGTKLEAEVLALKANERRCFAARAFQNCIRMLEHSYDEAASADVVVIGLRKHRPLMGQAAADFTRTACEGVRQTSAHENLLERLRAQLHDNLNE